MPQWGQTRRHPPHQGGATMVHGNGTQGQAPGQGRKSAAAMEVCRCTGAFRNRLQAVLGRGRADRAPSLHQCAPPLLGCCCSEGCGSAGRAASAGQGRDCSCWPGLPGTELRILHVTSYDTWLTAYRCACLSGLAGEVRLRERCDGGRWSHRHGGAAGGRRLAVHRVRAGQGLGVEECRAVGTSA